MAFLLPDERQAYDAFFNSSPSDAERIWFELNPGTFPIIKIGGRQKFANAERFTKVVESAMINVRPRSFYSPDVLQDLRSIEEDITSELVWVESDWHSAAAVLANSVNAFSSAALGVLFTLSPQGLHYQALYDSVDAMFRSGNILDEQEWIDAISKAYIETAAEDLLTGGSVLSGLLIEFANLSQNLIKIEGIQKDRDLLRRELNNQLDRIRSEIDRYQNIHSALPLTSALSAELRRQPNYIISVVREYESRTGINVS